MRIIKFNFDKILNDLVFVLALVVIVSQVMITVPRLNKYFSHLSDSQYIYTSKEIFKNKTTDLKLSLQGISSDERILILQNGEVVGCFTDNTVSVTVSDNSVIEIDAREVKQKFSVVVENNKEIVSELPKMVNISSNIAMIGRIFIKD